jgi:hypothetical protein
MCKFNVVDVLAIQECMEGYKRLIEWLPTMDEVEDELKEQRIKVIDRISRICDEVIASEKGKSLHGYAE